MVAGFGIRASGHSAIVGERFWGTRSRRRSRAQARAARTAPAGAPRALGAQSARRAAGVSEGAEPRDPS